MNAEKQPINRGHIGCRLLVTDGWTGIERTEIVVLELTPSGRYVKIKSGDQTYWEDNDGWEIRILELMERPALKEEKT